MCWLHALQKDRYKPQCSENQFIAADAYLFPPTIHFNKNLAFPEFFSRAENIIKEDELKKGDIRTINNTLIINGYPRFNRKRRPAHSESESQQTKIMTMVPYVQNLTEPIKRVLQQVGVGVAMKPVCVLPNIFCKPKEKVQDKEKSGFVNQIIILS